MSEELENIDDYLNEKFPVKGNDQASRTAGKKDEGTQAGDRGDQDNPGQEISSEEINNYISKHGRRYIL